MEGEESEHPNENDPQRPWMFGNGLRWKDPMGFVEGVKVIWKSPVVDVPSWIACKEGDGSDLRDLPLKRQGMPTHLEQRPRDHRLRAWPCHTIDRADGRSA